MKTLHNPDTGLWMPLRREIAYDQHPKVLKASDPLHPSRIQSLDSHSLTHSCTYLLECPQPLGCISSEVPTPPRVAPLFLGRSVCPVPGFLATSYGTLPSTSCQSHCRETGREQREELGNGEREEVGREKWGGARKRKREELRNEGRGGARKRGEELGNGSS